MKGSRRRLWLNLISLVVLGAVVTGRACVGIGGGESVINLLVCMVSPVMPKM